MWKMDKTMKNRQIPSKWYGKVVNNEKNVKFSLNNMKMNEKIKNHEIPIEQHGRLMKYWKKCKIPIE